jgi:glycosyltransferase involved in cell wall biosynthesis
MSVISALKNHSHTPTDEMVEKGVHPGDEFQVGPIDPARIHTGVRRVAMFTEAFLPKIDGVSKTAVLAARHLQQTGREVVIFAPDMNGNTPDWLGPSRVVSVPSLELPFVPETKVGFPSSVVNEVLDDFQPDLVHLFSPAVLSLSGLWYGNSHDLPVVANYQSDLPGYAIRYGYTLFSMPIRDGLRALHNNADLTLVPSHSTIRQLREWGFERLRLWVRGVDRRRFNPKRRSAAMRKRLLAGRPDDSLLVLYVGRLAQEKRVDLLSDVAALDGVALAVVGDGEERDQLEADFEGRAHFTGYLFGEELAVAYASADVFAFTGTHETYGQVVTEAMASGLPVLVPNAGGVVDLVLDRINGLVCQLNPDDYAAKVAYLRDHPAERRRMADRACEVASTRPWERVMAELEDYYAEACTIHASQE